MFRFIRDIFRKKEKQEVNFSEIENWIEQKTSPLFEESDNKITETKNKIADEIQAVKQNLEKLENAQLQNPNIMLKEKQFMEGNRDFYIKRVNFFINDINVPENKEEIESFTSRMHNDIEAFGKSTLKPYHILQQFFSHESYTIAKNIKNIDNLFKELKAIISDEKIESINRIKKEIISIKKKTKIKQDLADSLKEYRQKIQSIENERNDIESEISNIKQGSDYREYVRLKEDKEKREKEINIHKQEIMHYFSVLERSMKKYSKIAAEDIELLNNYIDNPIKTLVGDYELKIVKLLEKLKDNILADKIELKDKKREKTLQTIDKIDNHYLASFLTDYNSLLVDIRGIEERIDKNSVIDEIEDLKVNFNKKKQELEDIQNKVSTINSDIEKIDIDSIKNQLKENIEKELNLDIELTF